MTIGGVLADLTRALDRASIPYMVTGSLASAFHGTSRATQDVDVVIAPSVEQLRAFVGGLPASRYYVDLDTALDALRRESMFNVIDTSTGWKIDLIIRKSRPFSRAEFERRRAVDLLGARVFLASPEDVVIAKLEWAKLGQSRRQLDDVAGILRMRPDLDRAYLVVWVEGLHLDGQWRAACELAGIKP